jgi:ABC-type nitrate/sulfonate/bicarbonate transport system permease component
VQSAVQSAGRDTAPRPTREAESPPTPPAPTRTRPAGRLRRFLAPVLSIVGGVLLWQLVIVVVRPNPLAVVGPVQVWQDGISLLRAGTLWPDIRLSLVQLLIGMVIAVVLGSLAGLLLGAYRWIGATIGPWVTLLYTIPVIAVAPLVIVGLGIGDTAKIAIVAASGFFPIAINTQAGAAQVSTGGLRDVSRSFRASRWETFRFLTVPGTVPFILTGVRLAVGRALIALVAADLFGSTSGIGYLILSGQQNLKTDDVYVGVVALGVIGIVLTALVGLAERRVHAARSAHREDS